MKKWSRYQYFPSRPAGENGEWVTGCERHVNLSYQAALEGTVLLKNDGVLPFKKGSVVSVFGKAQNKYLKCGGGSGEVITDKVKNIYEALKTKESEGKISLYEPLYDFYQTLKDDAEVSDELINKASESSDIAVVVISRFSEETLDRRPEKGDYYLSDEEESLINRVTEKFAKTVVLLNVVGVVDTTPFANNDKISGLFVLWNGGSKGSDAIAALLCGDENPSGKLPDTFANSYSSYPSAVSFSESVFYTKYYEDIYVGYRYFETIPGAYEKVNYPFGFGLSYTNFDITDVSADEKEDNIVITATVKNTGKMSGKEVVQIYYSAPSGLLGKPSKVLGAFEKTPVLNPGDSCKVTMTINKNSMASYDDTGKISMSSYVLEKGIYSFHIGNSIWNTVKTDYKYELNEDVITEKLSTQCAPEFLEKRMLSDGSFEPLPKFLKEEKIPSYMKDDQSYNEVLASVEGKKPDKKIRLADVVEDPSKMDEFISQFSFKELEMMLGGQDAAGVSGTSGIGNNPEYGVPCIMTADGPAGLRVREDCGSVTTCFPSATAIASSWNKELAYEIGKASAMEVKENNIGIWLAPAMNIHRDPLCGRNFEYYSEDPLLAGIIASETVKGVQSQKISATIKHFACNNRETNRRGCDSRLSERALREIYLKGFEIVVKTASPWLIMTSYNPINGVQASENYELITNILRGEWGYKGAVTSDWITAGMHYKEVLAGNDIKMPYKSPGSVSEALKSWYITREDVEKCVRRVLQLIINIGE